MKTSAVLAPTTSSAPSRALHLGLWATQSILAAAFLMAGGFKLATPMDKLVAAMPWVSGSMGAFVRFIGAVEVLGAIGLILPSATKIAPRLTALAALGLSTTMTLALTTHVARHEYAAVGAPLVLGTLALFVAWGRGIAAPIARP